MSATNQNYIHKERIICLPVTSLKMKKIKIYKTNFICYFVWGWTCLSH